MEISYKHFTWLIIPLCFPWTFWIPEFKGMWLLQEMYIQDCLEINNISLLEYLWLRSTVWLWLVKTVNDKRWQWLLVYHEFGQTIILLQPEKCYVHVRSPLMKRVKWGVLSATKVGSWASSFVAVPWVFLTKSLVCGLTHCNADCLSWIALNIELENSQVLVS